MTELMSVDSDLALEVEVTREVFDDIFSRSRWLHTRALYAFHRHEKAQERYHSYIHALARSHVV